MEEMQDLAAEFLGLGAVAGAGPWSQPVLLGGLIAFRVVTDVPLRDRQPAG